jgi:hypothetical protein
MPPRARKPNEIARQVMPLLLCGAALIGSASTFTIIDDEARILGAAAQPLRTTLALFWSGVGQHEHPPLYDILLHFFLRSTGGAFESLRIPSILFFLAGLFLLARAAGRLGGPASAVAVVWLGVLWPFGFHYGRLAVWYSFSFFLMAGLTLAYLRYLEDQSSGRWRVLLLLGILLIWTNYFGWAILGCLAIDQLLRHRTREPTARPGILFKSVALLCVAFLPLLPAFRDEIRTGVNFHQSALAVLANAAFCVYSLFVSESMAPWYWRFSVPAGLAVLVCMGLVLTCIPRNVRRFLLYGAVLIAVMAVTGILNTKRLFLVAPWILLPVGVAVGANIKSRGLRLGLASTLLLICGIGWYGIYSRRFYSAPRFNEPWQKVAGDAADKIHGGATLISNNSSFFFYLTYILGAPNQNMPWKFAGLLPDQVHHPQVLSPEGWFSAGRPIGPKMIWIRGMNGPFGEASMDNVGQELDHACGARTSRLMMRDAGYSWKQRFFPELGESQWRIEVREYDCGPASSQEVFPIPSR